MSKAKPFSISKRVVWDAFKRVKANRGAAGVDGESIAEFESNLKGNLYKLWNRCRRGVTFRPSEVFYRQSANVSSSLNRLVVGGPQNGVHGAGQKSNLRKKGVSGQRFLPGVLIF